MTTIGHVGAPYGMRRLPTRLDFAKSLSPQGYGSLIRVVPLAVVFSTILACKLLGTNVEAQEYLACHAMPESLPGVESLSKLPPDRAGLERVVRSVLGKLVGDDSAAFLGFRPSVEIAALNSPFAYATTPYRIVVSMGLLKKLDTEDEVAFVIAHELGHLVLHHQDSFGSSAFDGRHRSLETLIQTEIDADSFASTLLDRSPFPANIGPQVLRKLSKSASGLGSRERMFPSIARRIKTLQTRQSLVRSTEVGS